MQVLVVKVIDQGWATVMLADGFEEQWSTASLPEGTEAGDHVGIVVEAGQFDMMILPRRTGFTA